MELVFNLGIMVVLGICTNSLATLKTIFVSKKAKKPVYILTFIDALLFGTVLKQISTGEDIIFVIAYAVGRVLGYLIGDAIESKIALGNSEIEMSLNNFKKMVEIADGLREEGYSVETYNTYGYEGRKRYKIVITTQRKSVVSVIDRIKSYGYEEPTLKIREIQKVEGKFTISMD